MSISDNSDCHVLGAGLIALGLALAVTAGVWGMLAAQHMAWAASLCGPASGHCLRCVIAATSAVASLATLVAGGLLLGRPLPCRQR